jgi:hypothetical protein
MTKTEKIAALKTCIREAAARAHEASMDEHRAEAKLARLEHRDGDATYHEAYVAAQTRTPGGQEWFWRFVNERDACRVLAGKAALADFAPSDRPGIEAAMERLRATDSGTRAG